jgi:DNA-binding PadR family transcriptional regulator
LAQTEGGSPARHPLDLLILKALSLDPLYGYGTIQRLRQLSDDLLEVEQKTLSPAVYRIEQRGWIKSWGRRGKNYAQPDKSHRVGGIPSFEVSTG